MIIRKKPLALAVGAAIAATAVFAATQMSFTTPVAISDGGHAYKAKIQTMAGTKLISVYGDDPDPATPNLAYDMKDRVESEARDLFVRTCDTAKIDCTVAANWTPAINISKSATKSSITTLWKKDPQGGLTYAPYPGDADKPNISSAGPVSVVTWVSSYCPAMKDTNGDGTISKDDSQQRAASYVELDGRILPFTCMWESHSTDNGTTWSAARQITTGERSANQDSSRGNYDFVAKTGRWAFSWQEDPLGLQLGEGDGASGALVSHGTDVWYTHASINLAVASTPADDFVLDAVINGPTRLTNNKEKDSQGNPKDYERVFKWNGSNVVDGVDPLDAGEVGASRPNIGLNGATTVIAYEETKGSEGLDDGKYVRYHTFAYAAPTAVSEGCIVSTPNKNARRVRFVYQGGDAAGPGGVQLAMFWKEGDADKGGPSDIMVRLGKGGMTPDKLVPAVDVEDCAKDHINYGSVVANVVHPEQGYNISTNTPNAGLADLGLDSEVQWSENALAHRALLRGQDLWVGYSYAADLGKLQYAMADHYEFWIRHYNLTNFWDNPQKITDVEALKPDTLHDINVREPRLVGTQGSSQTACPTGIPTDPTTTNPALCQNADVFYVAWGLQTNVSQWDPAGAEDLGLYITRTTDAGKTFEPTVQLSAVQGALLDQEESAYESQISARPDGNMLNAVWNQDGANGTFNMYTQGTPVDVADPVPAPTVTTASSGGGCAYNPEAKFDPTLPAILAAALAAVGLRRRKGDLN